MAETIISRRSYYYRIYPTRAQRTRLNQTLELCCELYNAALQERRDAWQLKRVSLNSRTQSAQLPAIKNLRPELTLIYGQVLQDVLRRVDAAFSGFFRRKKDRTCGPGFPRFRPRRRYKSITYPQNGFRLEGGRLILGKIGGIKIKVHRPVTGDIKTLTIKRSATDKWYAYFSVEIETRPLPVSTEAVGIDVGLTSFATLSTGEEIENPKFFRAEEGALQKANRRLSRCAFGTAERRARRKVVARIYERVKYRRKNFAHQLSCYLVRRFGVIIFEKLDIQGMLKNRYLAKSIGDAAWNHTVRLTAYKAASAGRIELEVNPRGTSSRTFCCSRWVTMPLSARNIRCPECGSVRSRDHNASLNILSLGLQTLGLRPMEAVNTE